MSRADRCHPCGWILGVLCLVLLSPIVAIYLLWLSSLILAAQRRARLRRAGR
jgi:hypothetical protein